MRPPKDDRPGSRLSEKCDTAAHVEHDHAFSPHFSHDVRVIAWLRDPSRGQSRTKGGAARRVVWGCGSSENAAPRICPTGTEARVATRLLMRWTLSRFFAAQREAHGEA